MSTCEEDSEPELIDPKSNNTYVTSLKEYFEIDKSSGSAINKLGKCILCKTTIKMKQSNTTGLKRHLKIHHYRQYNKLFPSKEKHPQDSKSGTLLGYMKPSTTKPTQKIFEEKCVDWIAMKFLPFRFFDDEATQFFFKFMNNDLNPPKRTSLKQKAIARYKIYKKAVAKVIEENDSKFSFTVDGWTSVANKSYYGITIHYIDASWKLQSFLFDFVPSRGLHTGKDIANIFSECLSNYKLEIRGITLDNAASNTTFVVELSKMLSEKNVVFNEDNHFRCFAHILNLGVQDIMKLLNPTATTEVDEDYVAEDYDEDEEEDNETISEDITNDNESPITKIRALFKKLKKSEQLNNRLISVCDAVNVQFISPKIDCCTRWNSTYEMLRIALQLKDALNILCDSNHFLKVLKVKEDEWKLITNVTAYLRNFKSLSVVLSAEKYVTLPLAIVGFNMLLDKIDCLISLLDHKENRDSVDENVLLAFQAGRDKMLKHYRKTNWVYCVTLILDPRHKIETFSFTDWGQEIKKTAVEKFDNIYRIFYYKDSSVTSDSSSSVSQNENVPDEDSSFDIKALFQCSALRNVENWRKEIEDYTSLPRADKDENILTWWSNHKVLYPNLARMARDFLAIQATSVPCERVFSKAGLLIRKHRNRLDHESARILLCLNSWQTCESIKNNLE